MKKQILSIIAFIVITLGLLPQNLLVALAQSSANSTVYVTNKLEIALAVGSTGVDYSTFAADLKKELMAQGIPAEDISVSELESSEVGTSSNFAWWKYDHTYNTPVESDSFHEYIEKTDSSNNTGHEYYMYDRHILVTNGGADLGFRGYGASAYKDFMYLTNDDPTKKTFQFDIEEGEAYDALDGVGFLFNTAVTGNYESNNQTMTGYLLFLQYSSSGRGQEIALYEFNNVDTKAFHGGDYGTISQTPEFTKIAYSSTYSSTDKFRKLRIEVQPKSVRVWYQGGTSAITQKLTDENLVKWTNSGGTSTAISIEATNAYGFGSIGSYRSHSCNRLTSIDLKNLTMSMEEPQTLMEVVREQKWQKNSEKFIVNLNEDTMKDFDDPEIMGELINRISNNNINYIGWGSNKNQEQTQHFIELNDGKGDFINADSIETSTYQLQIAKIAKSIRKQYQKEIMGEPAYIIAGDTVNMLIENTQLTDTADENWPRGKWMVKHDISGIDNASSIYELSNQYVSDFDVDFSLPGRYEIYYEDELVKTIISNRKPEALFAVEIVDPSDMENEASEEEAPIVEEEDNKENVEDESIIEDTEGKDESTNEDTEGKDESTNEDTEGKDDSVNEDTEEKDDSVNEDTEGKDDSANEDIEEKDDSVIEDTEGKDNSVKKLVSVILTDLSYDLDGQNEIDSTKTIWKYMKLSDQSLGWQVSNMPPTMIEEDEVYIISLIVTDIYGAVSTPYTRLVSYSNSEIKMKPFAEFELSTSILVNGSGSQIVDIIDKSYDVYDTGVNYVFTITKDGKPYEKSLQLGANDFSNDEAGTYVISMTASNDNGSSAIVTRTLVIVRDEEAPTVTSNVANQTVTGNGRITVSFYDSGKSGLKVQKLALTNSTVTPSEDSLLWSDNSSMSKQNVYMSKDGEYYIHYYAQDNAGNISEGYFGPFIYETSIPYVTQIITLENQSIHETINGKVVFQMSEKVVAGDGYLTIYNKATGKKYIDIHSSNNRVKMDNSGLVTVELPKVLEYNTSYYIVVGSNFVKDVSGKPMAQFGGADDWSFQTIAKGVESNEDEISVIGLEISQPDTEDKPVVNVDKNNPNTYKIYVMAGEFTIKPILSGTTDQIKILANDCTATLSEDKSTISVELQESATNPFITFSIGDNNVYTFKLIKTQKDLQANVVSTILGFSSPMSHSSLLSAVDLTEELDDDKDNITKIDIQLLLSEPQDESESDAVQAYIDETFKDKELFIFDVSLLKLVTYSNTTSIESKISNTQDLIEIRLDIDKKYQSNYNFKVVRNHNGVIEEVPATVVNKGTQLSFFTDRFSTYGVVYIESLIPPVYDDSDSNTPKEEIEETVKEVIVTSQITVKAGELAKVDIQDLPEGASIEYHVSTPTYISINKQGEVFGKKAAIGELFVKVTMNDVSTIYKVCVNVAKADKKPSKVGHIQYYNELVTYKNIQYRITKVAENGANATVAVANNQTNTKLPSVVVIPNSIKIDGKTYIVTSIDESAFYGIKTIESVSIPKTIESIATTAFTSCSALKTFTVHSSNQMYSAKGGMLLNKEGNVLVAYPSASGKITIDSKITTIGAYAFSVCKGLTEVIIPKTVKVIEGDAFAHASSLKLIKFGGMLPKVSYPSIFDKINSKAVILVNKAYLSDYQEAFKDAMQPKGVAIKVK